MGASPVAFMLQDESSAILICLTSLS